MAGNRFATMLHRNTHKITAILVYAILEWVLIGLLLLNSLFSYLIMRFANYFGLKPPCLLCCRVDHLFQPDKPQNSYTDLLCEHHSTEISNLGYCSNHRKLAESKHMCEDCSSSRNGGSGDFSGRIAFFSWVQKMGLVSNGGFEKKVENGGEEVVSKCSCCDVRIDDRELCSPYLLLKPSWGVLDYTHKGNSITKVANDEGESSDPCKSDCGTDRCEEDDEEEEENEVVEVNHEMLSDVEKVSKEVNCYKSPSSSRCGGIESDEDDVVSTSTSKKTEQDLLPEENDSMILNEGIENLNVQSHLVNMTQFSCCNDDDASMEILNLRPKNCFDLEHGRFVPVEMIDSMTLTSRELFRGIEDVREQNLERVLDVESKNEEREHDEQMGSGLDDETQVLLVDLTEADNTSLAKLETVENNVETANLEKYLGSPARVETVDLVVEECGEVGVTGTTEFIACDGDDVDLVLVAAGQNSEEPKEESLEVLSDEPALKEELETRSFIGREISGQESAKDVEADGEPVPALTILQEDSSSMKNDDIQAYSDLPLAESDHGECNLKDQPETRSFLGREITEQESAKDVEADDEPISALPSEQEYSSSMKKDDVEAYSEPPMVESDQGAKQTEEAETFMSIRLNRQLSIISESREMEEEEKYPETPTYGDGLQQLIKKYLLHEKKESGSTEGSLDGSVLSETENGEGSLTVEKLKSALKAEHKALSALYSELEEERSASAISANQTMAMITRLQEEKAAMQMEALQYQRMMEEQSEYDQEALQLLNELMVKREKEKQELEKELEVYRKKVLQYETREKKMMMRRKISSSGKSGTSSCNSSNAADSEELSIDLNHEGPEEDSFFSHQDTPNDGALNLEDMGHESSKQLTTLDESLADFEEERQSILEQLKALEEKLFTLGDDDDEEGEDFFEDMKPIEHFTEGNYEFNGQESNGAHDDSLSPEENSGKKNYKAKRLLPLFDAIDVENGEEEMINEEHDRYSNALFLSQNSSVMKFSPEEKKLAIEEEVDHVYERLQALEADREFLKHCVSSLKKGDKGMDLLQEILQHLRDLRNVELRAKNMGDVSL